MYSVHTLTHRGHRVLSISCARYPHLVCISRINIKFDRKEHDRKTHNKPKYKRERFQRQLVFFFASSSFFALRNSQNGGFHYIHRIFPSWMRIFQCLCCIYYAYDGDFSFAIFSMVFWQRWAPAVEFTIHIRIYICILLYQCS